MKTAGFVFGLVILLAVGGYAQMAPTVTNATLEKYQQKRLAAERDYKENYERLGFPSPEELQRQREVDMQMRLELVDQLRQARLEEERIDLERQSLNLEVARFEREVEVAEQSPGIYATYFGGSGEFGSYYGQGYGGYYRPGFGKFGGFYPGYGRFMPGFRFRGYPENWLLPQVNRGGYIAMPYGTIRNPLSSPAGTYQRGVVRGRR